VQVGKGRTVPELVGYIPASTFTKTPELQRLILTFLLFIYEYKVFVLPFFFISMIIIIIMCPTILYNYIYPFQCFSWYDYLLLLLSVEINIKVPFSIWGYLLSCSCSYHGGVVAVFLCYENYVNFSGTSIYVALSVPKA